ncbi:MAG TPA: O-antigen ligase family protein, partial [Flavisolibacter sp.]|nr:O-antigen ligase family protein [Flavisolibacter sp.]
RAVGILFLSMMLAMVLALFRHAGMGFRFESVNTALEPFFRNHVNYSALLVAMVPVNILLWQQASRPFQRNMLGLLLAVLLAALYVSYARGAWLALFTGMTAYVLVRRKMLVTAFLAMILLSLATVWWLQRGDRYLRFAPDYNHTVFHSDFGQHLVATYQLKDLSTAERFYRWIAGARLATDHWMTGTGPGTFYLNYKPYAIPAYKTWVSSNEEHSTVHNYFLLTLIEQGVAGLVLLLLLWLALLYYAQTLYQRLNDRFWKQVVAAVAAVLTMVATVNFLSDLIETDKVGPIFYMCAALLITVDYRSKNLNSSSHIQGIAEPVSE